MLIIGYQKLHNRYTVIGGAVLESCEENKGQHRVPYTQNKPKQNSALVYHSMFVSPHSVRLESECGGVYPIRLSLEEDSVPVTTSLWHSHCLDALIM